jgi:hypothetical protein
MVAIVKTLGIDLASDPKKTGVCTVRWQDGRAAVDKLFVGADDDQLLGLHERSDATGIDSPFGWPVPFEELVREVGRWRTETWSNEKRDVLRFRLTDFRVRELTGRWPLSVSSDLIAVAAMRCVGLLGRMGVRDRSGDGRVFETYPAAGLHAWGLPSRGYKKEKGGELRAEIWAKLAHRAPWLDVTAEQSDLIVARDDALDALVAALIARAAKIGLTVQPSEHERERAETEGWIHVPIEGSLERLNRP